MSNEFVGAGPCARPVPYGIRARPVPYGIRARPLQ